MSSIKINCSHVDNKVNFKLHTRSPLSFLNVFPILNDAKKIYIEKWLDITFYLHGCNWCNRTNCRYKNVNKLITVSVIRLYMGLIRTYYTNSSVVNFLKKLSTEQCLIECIELSLCLLDFNNLSLSLD